MAITVTGNGGVVNKTNTDRFGIMTSYLPRARPVLQVVCLALLPAIHGVCQAGTDVTPRLYLGGIYTDNVTLVDNGKDSEFITEVTPGFSANVAGSRVNGYLDYQLQSLFYGGTSGNTSSNHQLEGAGTSKLYKDIFFVDADASVFQSVTDPEGGPVALDNVSRTGNRTDVATFNISPYWKYRFNGSTDAITRYRFGKVNYGDDASSSGNSSTTTDSTIQEVSLSVGNLQEVTRKWSWRLTSGYTLIKYDNNREDTLRNAAATLGYRVTRKIQLTANGGTDNNDFETSNQNDTSGNFWDVGMKWNLSSKNQFEAGFGRRYDGDIYNFLWTNKGRVTTLDVSYDQTLNTYANVVSQESIPPLTGSGGVPLESENLFRRNNSVFERKLFSVNATVDLSKNTFGLTFVDERRENQDDSEEDQITSVRGLWDWRFSSRTSSQLNVYAVRQEFGNTGQKNDIYRISAGLTRKVARTLEANLLYSYSRQDSDDGLNEYQENRVSVFLLKTF